VNGARYFFTGDLSLCLILYIYIAARWFLTGHVRIQETAIALLLAPTFCGIRARRLKVVVDELDGDQQHGFLAECAVDNSVEAERDAGARLRRAVHPNPWPARRRVHRRGT
jgi:hypothetical protein